jgi:hypothetical protein
MNSASGASGRPTVGLRRPKKHAAPTEKARSASAKADARRVSALEGRFQSAQKPPAGRPARRMNSASRGLRPTVGLRRPKKHAPRRRRPTPGASAPWKADFNRHRAFGRRPARRMNSASRGLRPTVGLRRPKKHAPRRRRPTPGASAPWKADFNRHKSLRPAACTPNEFGLQGPPADGRPAPTEKARSASAKADARRTRFQSTAFGRRPTASGRRACADQKDPPPHSRVRASPRTVDASGKTRGGPPEGPATPSTGGCRGSGHSSSSSSSSTFFPRPMTSTSGASAGSGASSMASAAGAVTSAISSSGSLTMVTPGGA